ncbi:hypothetical protein LSH36_1134g00027 [Paralvinella palmiformis]|uniref:Uncharacterized protein n=1 Tax=Paralvinella palmiformis TaxID=53620 RepID=A0AAD9IWA9_9ANNE|nr:hypothetical protein LSH36_1134g00027 [Paralvinella palmiformis]
MCQRPLLVPVILFGLITTLGCCFYINRVQSRDKSAIYQICQFDWTSESHETVDVEESVQFGAIKSGSKYAVFTSSLHGSEATDYGFDLPLTAMAWNRIGFGSIIIIVGDPQRHKRKPWVQYLMDTLADKEYIVVLVLKMVSSSQATSISQVVRLFATSLVRYNTSDVGIRDTYLLTADADIWPISRDFFVLPPGKDILHGNIGDLAVDGLRVIHAPLSYVGMKIQTWYSVMTLSGLLPMPKTIGEIVKYFGDKFRRNVTHGGEGWYIDQVMISLRLHQWKLENENGRKVYVYQRQLTKDRIDRVHWPTANLSLEGIVDAHLLKTSYQPNKWIRLRPLLRKLFPDNDAMRWYEQYVDRFNKLISWS